MQKQINGSRSIGVVLMINILCQLSCLNSSLQVMVVSKQLKGYFVWNRLDIRLCEWLGIVFIVSEEVMFQILFIVMLYSICSRKNSINDGVVVESSLKVEKNIMLSIRIGL